MKDLQWFVDRVGEAIEYKKDSELWEKTKIMNKEHASWVHAGQEIGYEFRDVVIVPPNVCIACEG